MSTFIAGSSRTNSDIATGRVRLGKGEDIQGQRHDRIPDQGGHHQVSMASQSGGGMGDVEVDISAGQKMLSAISGSLLTSLLGMYFPTRCLLGHPHEV